MKPSISVCLIIKNESLYLRQCLESIKDIATEILIGDTGSTDNSPEISAEYGKVFPITWNQDFSKARNQVIKKKPLVNG